MTLSSAVPVDVATARLERTARPLRRITRLLAGGALGALALLLVVPSDLTGGLFAVVAIPLAVAAPIVGPALARLRHARGWPCSRVAVSITTEGEWHAQRVRAATALDEHVTWRCTHLLGVESRFGFTGEALVWIAPNGRRGIVATGVHARFLSQPRSIQPG